MGIQNLSLLSGATLSATGGTAMSFVPDGQRVPNGIHVVNAGQADFRIRENITAKYRSPVLNSAGEYTKAKNTLMLTIPMVTASGKTVFNLVDIRVEAHPELSAADASSLRQMAAQCLFDADLANFWAVGSLE